MLLKQKAWEQNSWRDQLSIKHEAQSNDLRKVYSALVFLWLLLFCPAHVLPVFCEKFLFSIEPSKEGSTENRNLLSAQAAHNVHTLRALLSAMEALPQAPWSGKAARFMAKSSTPHLWAHVRQFFLKAWCFTYFLVGVGAIEPHNVGQHVRVRSEALHDDRW